MDASLLPDMTLAEMLDSKHFSDGKTSKYSKTLLKQTSGEIKSYIGSFNTMTKSGEVQLATDLHYDDNGRLITDDAKPRLISVPDDVT